MSSFSCFEFVFRAFCSSKQYDVVMTLLVDSRGSLLHLGLTIREGITTVESATLWVPGSWLAGDNRAGDNRAFSHLSFIFIGNQFNFRL